MAAITVSADANGNLSLSDNGQSHCSRGEEVVWKPDNTTVSSIFSVAPKPAQPTNFWQTTPGSSGAKDYKGKISNSAPFTDWNYNIQADLISGGKSNILDPKITVDGI